MRIDTNNQKFGIRKIQNFNDTLKRRTTRVSSKDNHLLRQYLFKIRAEKEKSETINRQKNAEKVIARLKSIIENKNK